MTWMYIRRAITTYRFQPSLSLLRAVHNGAETARDSPLVSSNEPTSSCYSRSLRRLPLASRSGDRSSDYKIDIVDDETWRVSTGFAGVRKDVITPNQLPNRENAVNSETRNSDHPDFDDIDDLRICGKLFYKLDRDSKEYEEYNFDFHRNKSSKSKTKQTQKEDKTKRNHVEQKRDEMNRLEKPVIEKKLRVPTFNQLTGPYHEPFCLDVYISKASVCACIVHRATSKVVAVAHSISKDLKYELGSTRNAAACDAVGKVLAQRALADDIHNVVYTPRKGEKVEGKLQTVVQSVIDNGVWVKIKLKKTKPRKSGFTSVNYEPDYSLRL
ncbi:putative ribosomal protein L18 [Helianthus debilis subsp. tardiflorus]